MIEGFCVKCLRALEFAAELVGKGVAEELIHRTVAQLLDRCASGIHLPWPLWNASTARPFWQERLEFARKARRNLRQIEVLPILEQGELEERSNNNLGISSELKAYRAVLYSDHDNFSSCWLLCDEILQSTGIAESIERLVPNVQIPTNEKELSTWASRFDAADREHVLRSLIMIVEIRGKYLERIDDLVKAESFAMTQVELARMLGDASAEATGLQLSALLKGEQILNYEASRTDGWKNGLRPDGFNRQLGPSAVDLGQRALRKWGRVNTDAGALAIAMVDMARILRLIKEQRRSDYYFGGAKSMLSKDNPMMVIIDIKEGEFSFWGGGRGQNADAVKVFRGTIEVAPQLGSWVVIAKILAYLACIYNESGEAKLALDCGCASLMSWPDLEAPNHRYFESMKAFCQGMLDREGVERAALKDRIETEASQFPYVVLTKMPSQPQRLDDRVERILRFLYPKASDGLLNIA